MRVRSILVPMIATLALAGCESSTGSDFRRPQQIIACETPSVTICGTWQRSSTGYVGAWQDGATANLQVVRFDSEHIQLNRVDFGKNQDFTAVYTGTVEGRSAIGTVTWNAAGNVHSGTWTAEW